MTVLIGFLGSLKDSRGYTEKRWRHYRPNVGIVMHDELKIEKFYLIFNKISKGILDITIKDINLVRPNIKVIPWEMEFDNAYDLKESIIKQRDFVDTLDKEEEYLINFTTGTTSNHIAWFNLVSNHYLKANLVQGSKVKGSAIHDVDLPYENECSKGKINSFSLDEAKYDIYHQLKAPSEIIANSFLKKGIVTFNDDYNNMISMVEKVAVNNNSPILLGGSTGVGKTALAESLYELKKSRNIIEGEFVEVNCATLRADTAHSVLFGHIKGAFTGALSLRDGAVKRANNGVLFLDEIGTLPWDVQGMLLRTLESKIFSPMGSDKTLKSDFTLICGSNENLIDLVEKGEFREDLLARIDLWTFTLPDLKNRREDIAPNVDYEISLFEIKKGIRIRFNKEAKNIYLRFACSEKASWLRNFRDLSASIERMGVLSDEGVITVDVANDEIKRLCKLWGRASGVDCVSEMRALIESCTGNNVSLSLQDATLLKNVVDVCRSSKNARQAGRILYEKHDDSGASLDIINPGTRLDNYLKKNGLSYKLL